MLTTNRILQACQNQQVQGRHARHPAVQCHGFGEVDKQPKRDRGVSQTFQNADDGVAYYLARSDAACEAALAKRLDLFALTIIFDANVLFCFLHACRYVELMTKPAYSLKLQGEVAVGTDPAAHMLSYLDCPARVRADILSELPLHYPFTLSIAEVKQAVLRAYLAWRLGCSREQVRGWIFLLYVCYGHFMWF